MRIVEQVVGSIDEALEEFEALREASSIRDLILLVVGTASVADREAYIAHVSTTGLYGLLDTGLAELGAEEVDLFANLSACRAGLGVIGFTSLEGVVCGEAAVEVAVPLEVKRGRGLFASIRSIVAFGVMLERAGGPLSERFTARIRDSVRASRVASGFYSRFCEGPSSGAGPSAPGIRNDLEVSPIPRELESFGASVSTVASEFEPFASSVEAIAVQGASAQRMTRRELAGGRFCAFLYWLAHYFEALGEDLAAHGRFGLASHYLFRACETVSAFYLLGRSSASVSSSGRLLVSGKPAGGGGAVIYGCVDVLGGDKRTLAVAKVLGQRNSSVFGHGFGHLGEQDYWRVRELFEFVVREVGSRHDWSRQRRLDLVRRYNRAEFTVAVGAESVLAGLCRRACFF